MKGAINQMRILERFRSNIGFK